MKKIPSLTVLGVSSGELSEIEIKKLKLQPLSRSAANLLTSKKCLYVQEDEWL